MEKANQALEDQEITPQAKHFQKLREEEKKLKKAKKVVDEWVELLPDPTNKKGGKYRICKRMNNGNVHRLYLGRETQVKDLIVKLKKRGLKIVR